MARLGYVRLLGLRYTGLASRVIVGEENINVDTCKNPIGNESEKGRKRSEINRNMNERNLKNDWKTSGNPFPFCSASEPHAKRGVGDLALLALDLARRR